MKIIEDIQENNTRQSQYSYWRAQYPEYLQWIAKRSEMSGIEEISDYGRLVAQLVLDEKESLKAAFESDDVAYVMSANDGSATIHVLERALLSVGRKFIQECRQRNVGTTTSMVQVHL